MAMFHPRCGRRITLFDDNRTAVRNFSEFNYGLVLSSQPLAENQLFEVRIEKKILPWSGSIEIGVTVCDPETMDLPACATDLGNGTWMMSGNSILKDGLSLVEVYGRNLDSLVEGDCLGVMRTSNNDLIFYVNGDSQGVAATNIPSRVFAVVDLYGKCAQVSIVDSSRDREFEFDGSSDQSFIASVTNMVANISSDRSAGSGEEVDGDSESNTSRNSIGLSMERTQTSRSSSYQKQISSDRLRFHTRCGSLVKLSFNGRTAERTRPLDEFNDGVVMTNRTLRPDELFEIRIDRLVEKWSGSIEVGVTTHNPATLQFPATMTNMRSGTTMMSGNGILTNGKGTRREYGEFNLDELREGDRIGMVRKLNGDLHFFINGLDQGVAANNVPACIWGVVDLYGMTVKVTIVNRDEREEQNLMTRRNTSLRDQQALYALNDVPEEDFSDRLQFHPRCGTHAAVIRGNRTAHRPNALEDFNNGVVLTSRPLRANELFEVRLDKMVSKWAGSIEIGVTTYCPTELEYPATMTNIRSGTWMMTGKGVMQNGITVIDEYGMNLDTLQVGDRVGVMRNESGTLHFYVNSVDQGEASTNVPQRVYGVIDLYGQASQATIVDMDCSPDTAHSSISNATWPYSDLRFYHIHGRNARISNNGFTASRPRAYSEFSEAIVICNRPLRDGELFEVVIEKIVDRWSSSIEAGVTALRPDELEFPSTMTEIDHDTWMLSGSALMRDGTVRNMYSCDLDTLPIRTRLGMMRTADGVLHYYVDGADQGPAFEGLPQYVYPVIDLYGQCAQVSIVSHGDTTQGSVALQCLSENSCSQQAQLTQLSQHLHQQQDAPMTDKQPPPTHTLHRFIPICGKNVILSSDNTAAARRGRTYNHGLVFCSVPLHISEIFEVQVAALALHWAGSLAIGLTTLPIESMRARNLPECIGVIDSDTWYLTGNEVRKNNTILKVNYCHSLDWLAVGNRVGIKRTPDNAIHFLLNGKDMGVAAVYAPRQYENLYPVLDLYGSVAAVGVTSCSLPAAPLAMVTDMTATSAPIRLASGESPLGSPTDDQVGDDYSQHSSRLHDSLENIFLEQRRSSEVSEAKVLEQPEDSLTSLSSPQWIPSADMLDDTIAMELHDIHGLNLVLGEGRRSARRILSYNNAVVLTARPIIPNKTLQIRLDRLNPQWVSSIMLGVTCQFPEQAFSLPPTALGFKQDTWVLSGDSVYHNGSKARGRWLFNLDTLSVGSIIGLRIDAAGLLFVSLNGQDTATVATDLRPAVDACYFVVDVYGQCEEVSVLGAVSNLERNIAANNSTNAAILASSMDCLSILQPDSLGEKADLETHEKDTSVPPLGATQTPDDNLVLTTPNQNDIANLTLVHQSSHISASGLSNRNSFFLADGQSAQSSNSSNSYLCGSAVASFSYGCSPTLSGLNSHTNLNGSSTNFIYALSNVCDGNNSGSILNNWISGSTSLATTSLPSSPATPVITPCHALKSYTNCGYLQACGRFTKFIGLPDGFFVREGKMCYCVDCTPQKVGEEAFLRKGDPPVKYSVPTGWCRFPLRRRCVGDIYENWHVAYHGTRVSNLRRILDRGELLMQDNLGLTVSSSENLKSKDDDTNSAGSPLILSPSIKFAAASATKHEFVDPKTRNKLLVHVAFQVLVRPGSYKVGPPSMDGVTHSIDPHLDPDSSEWVTKERGATLLQALLLRLEGLD
ncbi:bluestreak [Frankliniella occidentalis]|uniref:Neuralized-like protein 4 n=1 Tax=Frankliniella occidentalis TaxID=133901 RepID=A0A6J1SDY7_FRAOC|nr:neuralized-like protein 4 [Frankliniella occidentalis]KAE8743975.1 bluestreak [Frankliniella occidentalis]